VSAVTWKDAPTRTVDVGGVLFAYRELGPDSDVPVIFLHHFTAVLDDWDPRVIDGIAATHRVIAFDNRGVGASGGSVPHTVEEMGRGGPSLLVSSTAAPERDAAWSLAATVYPGFDSYQRFTDRQIPVAVLERRAAR
jgi:pimeloyl-ACP methyl ester carboxylesterase